MQPSAAAPLQQALGGGRLQPDGAGHHRLAELRPHGAAVNGVRAAVDRRVELALKRLPALRAGRRARRRLPPGCVLHHKVKRELQRRRTPTKS